MPNRGPGDSLRQQTSAVRLFYALWPDEGTRSSLLALQHGIHGRKVDAANLHLTLAFLGHQQRDSLELLECVMQSLAPEPFTLQIDAYGYFSKPRIAWAGPTSPPETLMNLQHALWQGLLDRGLRLKPVARFRPHVTLARDAEPIKGQLAQAIRWEVGTMALVASVATASSVRYQLLASRQF